jgi:hypothetical protein
MTTGYSNQNVEKDIIGGGASTYVVGISRHRVQIGCGVHSSSYPTGIEVLTPRVKRPGREADHSPSSSGEVKNAWS